MGDSPTIPWRLLDIEILVEDHETGGKNQHNIYAKCSKILNAFLLLFSNKMLVIMAGIHNMLARKANREDSDQTASLEAV